MLRKSLVLAAAALLISAPLAVAEDHNRSNQSADYQIQNVDLNYLGQQKGSQSLYQFENVDLNYTGPKTGTDQPRYYQFENVDLNYTGLQKGNSQSYSI